MFPVPVEELVPRLDADHGDGLRSEHFAAFYMAYKLPFELIAVVNL